MSRTKNLLAIITCTGALLWGMTVSASIPRVVDEEPSGRGSRDWRGGPVSLPIGREHLALEILNAAAALPQTQDLEALFYSRGYVRRSDLDAAGGNDTLSFAMMGWQKPGVAVTQESPVIRIISKRYFDGDLGRQVIATQAFGGVVWDSAGRLATYDSGTDSPAAVVESVPAGTPGAIAPDPGKGFETRNISTPFRFAYHEGPGGVGTMIKDTYKATCPFRRGLAKVSTAFAIGAVGAAGSASGNWWAAGALCAANAAADLWIDAKMTCQ